MITFSTPSAGTYKMWLSRWGFAWTPNNTRLGLLVYSDPFCGGDIENNRNSNILYASSLQQRSQTFQSVSNKRPNFLHNFSAEFCICLSLIPAKTTKQQRSQTSQSVSDKRPNFLHKKQTSVYVYHCGCQTNVLIFTFPGIHIPKKQGFVESDKKRR